MAQLDPKLLSPVRKERAVSSSDLVAFITLGGLSVGVADVHERLSLRFLGAVQGYRERGYNFDGGECILIEGKR